MLRPRAVVPVHWGTLAPAGMTRLPNPWRDRMRRLLVEPPRRFAAAVAAHSPSTHVALTEPGAPVALPQPGRWPAAPPRLRGAP
jgi:hypothetical protein